MPSAELKPGEEFVTVAVFERRRACGPGLMNPVPNVRVTRQDVPEGVYFVAGPDARVWHLAAGTEITDGTGRVYRVTRTDTGRDAFAELVSAPPPVPQTAAPRLRRPRT